MNKSRDILVQARKLAEKATTWADLSNALFGPVDGLVSKYFRDAADRAAFRKTETYDLLDKLVEERMQQTGVAAGAEPTKKSGF